MTMTFVSLSVTQFLNWKNRQITAGFCKKFGIRFSVKNQQKHQILESRQQKSPKPLEKIEKLHRETATAVENGSKSPFQRIEHTLNTGISPKISIVSRETTRQKQASGGFRRGIGKYHRLLNSVYLIAQSATPPYISAA